MAAWLVSEPLSHLEVAAWLVSEPLSHLEVAAWLVSEPLSHLEVAAWLVGEPLGHLEVAAWLVSEPAIHFEVVTWLVGEPLGISSARAPHTAHIEERAALEAFIVVVLFIAVTAFSIWQQFNTIDEWKALAAELKLKYVPSRIWGVGHIEGSYNGFAVLVDHYTKGSRKRRRTYTKIVTRFNKPMPAGLMIYQETAIISDIGKFFGGQDIEVNAPKFDETFIVKGEPEEAVRRLLTPSVRGALLRYNYVTDLCLDERSITHTERGLVRDANHIRHILDAQHEVAKALCGEV